MISGILSHVKVSLAMDTYDHTAVIKCFQTRCATVIGCGVQRSW